MEFITTADGSKTLYNAEVGECYHSKHGACQESIHVFLNSGLKFFLEKEKSGTASILEVGFGTGLNFLLTADYCTSHNIPLDYCGVEASPLPLTTIEQIGYGDFVSESLWSDYLTKYEAALLKSTGLNLSTNLQIVHAKVLNFHTDKQFDIIYFDAFAAVHQPEMWDEQTLAHVNSFLRPGGVFVTYAITGHLKRTMKALGFTIEKAHGAPGKREMLRAIKQ